MTIIRSPRKAANFLIVSNDVLLDPRLSMRALGLLVRLLSRPDNWQTNSELLANEFSCGRDQMRAVLAELREAGYLSLEKTQDERGLWSSRWLVFDLPGSPAVPENPSPKTGNRLPGEPHAGDLGASNKTDLTRTDKKTVSPAGSRLPADWTLPDEWRAFCMAERPDLDASKTAESFRDFWISTPGAKGRKADWLATWRNWVRGQRKEHSSRFGGQTTGRYAGAAAAIFGHGDGHQGSMIDV